ncbi:lipoyl domain-containing protein [Flagellimonas sp. DF-77]|uniref:biotin/lipoyl-containing protein n=1 Tax=Flagellimonas algarum TaxID=3230298 RepID=UPI003399E638
MLNRFIRWISGLGTAQNATLEHQGKRPHSNAGHVVKGHSQVVRVPDLGYGQSYRLTKWHKEPGDHIRSGDIVCSLENETILFEFESLYSGRLQYRIPLNQKMEVGEVLFHIEGM